MVSTVLFTDEKNQEGLFNTVANQLIEMELVKPEYKEAVKEREKDFPTGLKIDYKDSSDILFAAIPHTETKYCLAEKIVYVKNKEPITFKHMINPEEDCQVEHFFFIINNNNEGQTEILSNLITFFITKGNIESLNAFGSNKDDIKKYLIKKGVVSND